MPEEPFYTTAWEKEMLDVRHELPSVAQIRFKRLEYCRG